MLCSSHLESPCCYRHCCTAEGHKAGRGSVRNGEERMVSVPCMWSHHAPSSTAISHSPCVMIATSLRTRSMPFFPWSSFTTVAFYDVSVLVVVLGRKCQSFSQRGCFIHSKQTWQGKLAADRINQVQPLLREQSIGCSHMFTMFLLILGNRNLVAMMSVWVCKLILYSQFCPGLITGIKLRKKTNNTF